ncbi:hypothetical protein GW17_00018604 [Ensete ventricosum]|nr:hypothetical protein GW17_00018604 [Ensete ventricosum]
MRHKKVKVLTRRHKSRPGEGESRSRSKGKEPATPSEEPEAPAGSEEGGASPAHERPRSMKDLFKTKVHKGDAGYYAFLMSDLGHQDPEKEMEARWKGLKNSMKVWNNSSAREFEWGLLHPQLARELYTLPSEVLMARAAKEMVLAVAKVEERASKLREELEKTERERGEELLRREASEKELHEVRSHLGDAQWLLKEARVGARLDGWIPRTSSRVLTAGVVERGSGGGSIGCRPYLCQVGRTTAGVPILVSDQLSTLGRRASCPMPTDVTARSPFVISSATSQKVYPEILRLSFQHLLA